MPPLSSRACTLPPGSRASRQQPSPSSRFRAANGRRVASCRSRSSRLSRSASGYNYGVFAPAGRGPSPLTLRPRRSRSAAEPGGWYPSCGAGGGRHAGGATAATAAGRLRSLPRGWPMPAPVDPLCDHPCDPVVRCRHVPPPNCLFPSRRMIDTVASPEGAALGAREGQPQRRAVGRRYRHYRCHRDRAWRPARPGRGRRLALTPKMRRGYVRRRVPWPTSGQQSNRMAARRRRR